jgi:RNA polymerase sigma-70 factor (ECF subfamily)
MGERPPALRAPSDASLIAASAASPECFSLLFDRHFVAIHRYLARRVGREAADDLASLCFTVAFERRGSFNDRFGDARPWLYGIATNLLREHWRSEERSLTTIVRLRRDRAGGEHDGGSPDPGGDHDLGRALAALEPEQRDVLLLYAWAELSYGEIAVALGVPLGTVRSRLARARERVRAELELPRAEMNKSETERIGHARRA